MITCDKGPMLLKAPSLSNLGIYVYHIKAVSGVIRAEAKARIGIAASDCKH